MSRKLVGDKRKVARPPAGEPFVCLTRELACSPAWRGQSHHCWRFVNFLMVEHMEHGGGENGNLAAPFSQLEKLIGRRYIAEAIREAEARRLVEVMRGGLRADRRASVSRYRLTFCHAKTQNEFGQTYYVAPTNEWRRTTEQESKALRKQRPPWNRSSKKKMSGAHGVTDAVHTVSLLDDEAARDSVVSVRLPQCTPCELPSISRVDASLALRLFASSATAVLLAAILAGNHGRA